MISTLLINLFLAVGIALKSSVTEYRNSNVLGIFCFCLVVFKMCFSFSFFFFFIFMCMHVCLHASVCTTCVPGAQGWQTRWKLSLWMVVCHHKVLETNPGHPSVRRARALSCWVRPQPRLKRFLRRIFASNFIFNWRFFFCNLFIFY